MHKKIIQWTLACFCEIDKYASKAYCAIHGVDESLNLMDIQKTDVDKIPDFDLMTWGFPCQSVSRAGKQTGFIDSDGSLTSSGLYYEGLKILKHKKPKISFIENVENLTQNRFKDLFDSILNDLDEAGYNSYWKVLNSNQFGVPQNRKRVFIVSIRKDIDNGKFHFPEPIELKKTLLDVVEKEIDPDLILSIEDAKIIEPSGKSNSGIRQVGQIYKDNPRNPEVGRIYDARGISPTLNTCQGGNRMPKITVDSLDETFHVKEAVKKGYSEAHIGDSVNLAYPNSKLRRGRIGRKMVNTLTTSPQQVVLMTDNSENHSSLIKKLSPKECWRLMDFSDEQFEKAKATGASNSQLYKMAGNSIVVSVLYYIFLELYKALPDVFDGLKVGSFFSGIGAYETALERLYENLI